MRRRLLKDVLASLWPRNSSGRVLYYHSLASRQSHYSLSSAAFREQIRWLKSAGYEFITFSQVARMPDIFSKGRWVCITFDDGYADNYECALPVLVEEAVCATFFVVSSYMTAERRVASQENKLYAGLPMLTRAEVVEMARSGMEIGSHTRTHVNVRRTLERRPDKAWEELNDSRRELEDIVGSRVSAFAYPNGHKGVFSSDTKRLLQEAGYCCAGTTMWSANPGEIPDPWELPRSEIRADDDLATFVKKMRGQYDYMRFVRRWRDGSRTW